MKDREVSNRPSPIDIWRSLAFCAVCDAEVPLKPAGFVAPVERLPPPMFMSDGGRAIVGALYFRDPVHNSGKSFENYCGAACSLVGHRG